MWNTIYKKVDERWLVVVTHMVYGEGVKNDYSVFVKHKTNNWLWENIRYNRNTIPVEILKMKKKIILDNRVKPSRIMKSRR